MTHVVVQRAGAEMAETVGHLIYALQYELVGGRALDQASILKAANDVLQEKTVTAFIAWIDDEPVGIIILNECAAIYAGGRFGEISELYVEPEMRSKGVAARLLEAALALAEAKDWRRLEVGAPLQPRWRRSLNFYLGNGFEEIGPRLRRIL